MADKKISALTTTTTPLAGTEVLPIVQSSSTKKVSVSDLTAGRTVLAEQLSVGGTASSWSGFKAVDISDSGGIAAFPGFGMGIFRNVYYDGSNYRYKIAGAASFLELDSNGKFNYQTAVSGSANGVIPSFTSRFEVEENTGNTYVKTGNLIIGTSGKGIDFSATTEGSGTMTSELLDDYEEGTWTPSLGGDTTYFHNYGSYVKVGRQVTVTGFLYIDAIGTGSTTTLSGLPFTSENTYQKGCLSIGEVANLAVNVTSLQGQIAAIASTISFFGFTAAASGNTPAVAIFQNQTVLYFAATYIASA
jgi:hypothetical protein